MRPTSSSVVYSSAAYSVSLRNAFGTSTIGWPGLHAYDVTMEPEVSIEPSGMTGFGRVTNLVISAMESNSVEEYRHGNQLSNEEDSRPPAAIPPRRQISLSKGKKVSFVVRSASDATWAIINGAICYESSTNASGSDEMTGAPLFATLYLTIFSMSEIPSTVLGRSLVVKHRKLGHSNPTAKTIAEMVVDAPVHVFQPLCFAEIFYFLLGGNAGARYSLTFCFSLYSA